ncbi:unnamed protein product [Ixodes persulcatus]
MSKERSQRQPPLAALDEKSQSEPRLEPSASALVEHGDSRRPSVSVNEGDLGSLPPVGEHPRKSLGSLDFGDSGPEKSDPLSAAPVPGDNVDIAKEFLEGIWGGSEESPPKSPLTLASLPEVSNEDIRLKPLESLSGVEEEEDEARLPLSSEPRRGLSEDQVRSPKKDKGDSVSPSTGVYTTETRTETVTGSTSETGETEEETDQNPPTPPPTQASVQRPESRPSSGGSDSRPSDTEGSSTDRTSESESTESLELGKEDMEAPLLPKKESDRKGAEVPKVGAASLGTKEIKQSESHAPPLSSSSTAKSSTTKTSSGAQIQPSAFSDTQTKRPFQKAAVEKKAIGEPGSKVAGNDPAQYARTNNEAHRDAETKKRKIPCILLVLNIIVAMVLILLYHLLLIRELERRAKEERPEAFIPATESVDDHVCRSVQCSAAGTHLFYVLNTSANPCRSIYDYVCKSWIHLPPTSYRKVVLGAERLFVDSKYAEMDNALRMPDMLSHPSIAVRKASCLYRDCLREAEKSRGGAEHIRALLESYDMGAWPFMANIFFEPYKSLGKFIGDTGVGALVAVKMAPDPSNPKARMIALDCSTFAVPFGVLLSSSEHTDTTLRGYKTYISETISALHPDQDDIDLIAGDVIKFEINLAHQRNRSCQRKKYKSVTLATLTEKAGIKWKDFLAHIFGNAYLVHSLETRVLVRSLEYIQFLSEVLLKNEKSLHRAMNYIGWRVTHHFMRQAGMSYRNLTNTFMESFIKAEPMPKWRSCLADVNDVMPLAIGSVFVDHGLWRDNQFKASRIAVSLLEVLAVMFERWPEDGTRSTFSDLRNDMDFLISYPSWIKHAPTLDAYYDGVKSGGDYFDRYVSASRVHYQNYLLSSNATQRHRPLAEFIFPSRIVDLKLLSGTARENVFYDSRDNTLILPAGALQPPYYDSNSPLGLVFGGLGTLVARDLVNELFHTSEGVLKEDQSKNVFNRKSQCLLDGMKKGLASNASLDSSSVITDVFTLRVAFEGYHIFMGTEEDNTLQGVAELTPDQLFFISAVRTLCTSIRERHFAQVVLLKKSVTEMKLIDTAVMQMREFDDTFHCEKKDSGTLKQNLFNKCVYTSS